MTTAEALPPLPPLVPADILTVTSTLSPLVTTPVPIKFSAVTCDPKIVPFPCTVSVGGGIYRNPTIIAASANAIDSTIEARMPPSDGDGAIFIFSAHPCIYRLMHPFSPTIPYHPTYHYSNIANYSQSPTNDPPAIYSWLYSLP